MDQLTAAELALTLIATGEVHEDYVHVCELATKYEILTTGKNIGALLIQYTPREPKILFDQRVRLTQPTTPAVASSLVLPFQKVGRVDRIRQQINLKNEAKKTIVQLMEKGYYGEADTMNRGLNHWLKTRFLELNATDPNAWVVVEWDTPEDQTLVVQPRPFEVSSYEAKNWKFENNQLQWLWVAQCITFYTVPANRNATLKTIKSKQPVKVNGTRYTLYERENTIVVEQVDKKYLQFIGYVMKDNEELLEIGGKYFIRRLYQPNIGYVPAFRIGYIRDLETKGRTFVNIWHTALCYFMKMLKAVSEMDLTVTLHVFPQKYQYVQKCPGPTRKDRCNLGRLQNGSECSLCKGTGYKVHTTAQDSVMVPMPEDPKDMYDLEKLSAYKAPPIDLIKFQNDYTLQLERQCHQAVFNSTVFIKIQSGAGGDGTAGSSTSNTATEADYNMASVYDTLRPYTQKFSELWMIKIITFAIISGENRQDVDVLHAFPADPKMKTQTILLAERGQAKTAGVPAFVLEAIDDDMASVIYAGDPMRLNEYVVQQRYNPFRGKTPEEQAMALNTDMVPKEFKVLYYNFSQIFMEIEIEVPDFYLMIDIKKQKQLVFDKVAEYIEDRLQEEAGPMLDRGIFGTQPAGTTTDVMPAEGDPSGDGNPGGNNNNS